MPPYGGRVSGMPFVLSVEGWPRARRRRSASPSEVEARGAVEGFGGEPSSEAEITPWVGGADGPHCVRGLRVGLL